MDFDGAPGEERVIFCQQIGYTQTITIIKEETVPPCARIEIKYDYTYRNDVPTKFEKLSPLFNLEPHEAKLLGEVLITAAEAAEAAIKKHKKRPASNRIQ